MGEWGNQVRFEDGIAGASFCWLGCWRELLGKMVMNSSKK